MKGKLEKMRNRLEHAFTANHFQFIVKQDRQTDRYISRQANRQRYKQVDRQTNRKTDKTAPVQKNPNHFQGNLPSKGLKMISTQRKKEEKNSSTHKIKG